jgi:hypothetical protein
VRGTRDGQPGAARAHPERADEAHEELGYGRGYEYDHDAGDAFSGQNCFPDGMARSRFDSPTERDAEAAIAARLREWASGEFVPEGKARPGAVLLDLDRRLMRRLGSDEAPPVLRRAVVDPQTRTVVLASDAAAEAARGARCEGVRRGKGNEPRRLAGAPTGAAGRVVALRRPVTPLAPSVLRAGCDAAMQTIVR